MKKRKELKIEDKQILLRVKEDLELDRAATCDYRENLIEWDKLLMTKSEVVEGRTYNEKIPLVKIAVNTLKSRVMQLINKRVTFKPTEDGDVDKIKASENFFDWVRTSHIEKMFQFLDHSLSTLIEYGTIFSTVTWIKEEHKIVDYRYFPAEVPVMVEEQSAVDIGGGLDVSQNQRKITTDDIIRDVIPESESLRITDVSEIGEDHVRIKYDEHVHDKIGKEQWRKRVCEIDFSLDEAHNQIVAVIEKQETKFEGADLRCENIDNINFYADSEDPQKCDHIIKHFRCTVSDLLRNRDLGVYDFSDDDLEKIRKSSIIAEGVSSEGVEVETKTDEGTAIQDVPENFKMIEGDECYYLWDVDGKGYLDQVIFTVIEDAQVVIRKKYLNEVFRHGMRPIQVGVWDIRKQRMLGLGLVESLAPLQKLVNDLVNVILNSSKWALNPPGFYDPTVSSMSGTVEYKDGELTPIAGPPPSFLEFPANFPVGFQLLSFFIDLFQRESASSDQLQGQAGGVKTATATVKLIQESYQNMSLPIARCVEWLKDVYRHIWKLYISYMPDTMKYRVMGPEKNYEFKEIKRSDLILNPDLTLEINVEETSKAYMQQVAVELFEKISLNPILLQAGITTPTKIYNAARAMVEAYAKGSEKYIQEPQEIEAHDPMKENNMMIEGRMPEISPLDDDAKHMVVHDSQKEAAEHLKAPEDIPGFISMINAHNTLHMQQAQMKAMQQAQMAQQMQAQQPGTVRGQQANNQQGNADALQGKVTGSINPGETNRFAPMPIPGMGTV